MPLPKIGWPNVTWEFPLSGTPATGLATFLKADLLKIPGVAGAHNYVLDGNDAVLASNNPADPPGSRFIKPGQVAALQLTSGDRNGHYYDQVPIANSTWRIVLTALKCEQSQRAKLCLAAEAHAVNG